MTNPTSDHDDHGSDAQPDDMHPEVLADLDVADADVIKGGGCGETRHQVQDCGTGTHGGL